MKINKILKKQGELYKNLPNNEKIKKYKEKINPVPYRGFLISEREYKAIKGLEELLGKELGIINRPPKFDSYFEISIEKNKITYLCAYNRNLTKIPKEINNLTNLQELYLFGNKITEIKNLDNLITLQILDLCYNNIKKIKNLDSLINLQELNLGHNQITEIKGLDKLQNLKKINMYRNKLWRHPISNRVKKKRLKKRNVIFS